MLLVAVVLLILLGVVLAFFLLGLYSILRQEGRNPADAWREAIATMANIARMHWKMLRHS